MALVAWLRRRRPQSHPGVVIHPQVDHDHENASRRLRRLIKELLRYLKNNIDSLAN